MRKPGKTMISKTTLYFWTMPVVILSLGAGIRFYQLGQPSLWIDEAFTWWFTQNPWSSLFSLLRMDGVNPPLYYLPVQAVRTILGDSEFALRLVSAVMSVLAIAFGMIIGYKVAGYSGLIAAGVFLAFHPMAIWYARDARPYALVSSLAMLAFLTFLILQKENKPWFWVIAFLALSLGSLTHYYFFLLGGILIFFAIADIRNKPIFFRRWVGTTLLSFIPLSLWIVWYFRLPAPTLGIGWIAVPHLLDLPLTIWNLLSGYGGRFSAASLMFGLTSIGLVVFALSNSRENRLEWKSFLLGIVTPIVAVSLVSLRRPVYMDRYFILLLPFVTLLVSRGAQEAQDFFFRRKARLPAWAGCIAVFVLVGISFWAAWQVHTGEQYAHEDWRGLAGVLRQKAESAPIIWFSEPEAGLPFRYYNNGAIQQISADQPPICTTYCWWILRQPYTMVHAFAQGITDPKRPWKPGLPEGCQLLDRWDSPSGVAAWRVRCD